MCTNITYYDIILNNSNNTKYRNNVRYSTTMTDIYDMHFPFTTDQSLKFWVCVSRKTASSLKMSPDFLFSFVHYLFMSWHVNVGQWLLKGDQHKVCELWNLTCWSWHKQWSWHKGGLFVSLAWLGSITSITLTITAQFVPQISVKLISEDPWFYHITCIYTSLTFHFTFIIHYYSSVVCIQTNKTEGH